MKTKNDCVPTSKTASGSLTKKTSENENSSYHRKWFVLIVCFYANICIGFVTNMTVLNAAFLTEFDKSKAETALVQSLATGIYLTSGVVFGACAAKYGTRKVGMTGGVLASLGTTISFFATSIPFLVVTLGALTGFGLSACFIAAGTSVGENFDGKPRLLALSFISFGSGCGGIMYPYLLDFLIGEFGWRGCLLIIGGLMMNMVPCFAICKPTSILKSNLNDIGCGNGGSKRRDSKGSDKLYTIKMENLDRRSALSDVQQSNEKNNIRAKLIKLLHNKEYLLFTLAMVFAIPAGDSLVIFLVNLLEKKGFDRPTAISLYFCVNIFNALFRFAPGLLNLIPYLNVMMIPAIITSIGAIACGLLPTVNSYVQHWIILACFGMARGGNLASMYVTTMTLVGKDLYSTGLGVVFTILGFTMLLSGPISGHVRDVSGSYDPMLYGTSAGMGVATCLCVVTAILRKCNKSQSREYSMEESAKCNGNN